MGDRDMSRQLTSGVLGRKKTLTNEYLKRVYSEPYSVIGAGVLNWDANGNPPIDLFDSNGKINANNYNFEIAKEFVINKYDELIETFDDIVVGWDHQMGIKLHQVSGNYFVSKIFDIKNQYGDLTPALSNPSVIYKQNFISSEAHTDGAINSLNDKILKSNNAKLLPNKNFQWRFKISGLINDFAQFFSFGGVGGEEGTSLHKTNNTRMILYISDGVTSTISQSNSSFWSTSLNDMINYKVKVNYINENVVIEKNNNPFQTITLPASRFENSDVFTLNSRVTTDVNVPLCRYYNYYVTYI